MLLLFSCKSTTIVMDYKDPNHQINAKEQHKFLFFIQSFDQISSRISMDRVTRYCKGPSIQGYLYTKGEPINSGNINFWNNKILQDGFNYIAIITLVEADSTIHKNPHLNNETTPNFFEDYRNNIAPFANNPAHNFGNKLFQIQTNLYYSETNSLVYTSLSKVYNPKTNMDAFEKNIQEVLKKMNKAGF